MTEDLGKAVVEDAKNLEDFFVDPRLQKKKPVKREQNLQRMRNLPCAVCNMPKKNDAHHIKSVGSGGGDELTNVVSLCRFHHTECHQIGRKTFYAKYKPRIDSHREMYKLPKAKF